MNKEFKAKQIANLLEATALICELRNLTKGCHSDLGDQVEELNESIFKESYRIVTGEVS